MRGARLSQLASVTPADVAAEHFEALATMTDLQVAALRRVVAASTMASFPAAVAAERLERLFVDEARSRCAGSA